MNDIPLEITFVLENAAKRYSESPATTNAGIVLRTISRFIPIKFLVKLFAHKLSEKTKV